MSRGDKKRDYAYSDGKWSNLQAISINDAMISRFDLYSDLTHFDFCRMASLLYCSIFFPESLFEKYKHFIVAHPFSMLSSFVSFYTFALSCPKLGNYMHVSLMTADIV